MLKNCSIRLSEALCSGKIDTDRREEGMKRQHTSSGGYKGQNGKQANSWQAGVRKRRNQNNGSISTVKALAFREESSCFKGVEVVHIRKLMEQNRLNTTMVLREINE